MRAKLVIKRTVRYNILILTEEEGCPVRKLLLIPAILLCVMLCACLPTRAVSLQSPADTPAPTPTASSSILLPEPSQTINPTDESGTEEPETYDETAQACKVTIDGWTYYLDTENPVQVRDDDEYPLYRENEEDTQYLGTTGFEFLIAGKYIYVKQAVYFGDYGHWLTRRVDLNGRTSKLVGESWNIFVSTNPKKLYITDEWDGKILIADYACEHIKTIKIILPDWKQITKKYMDAYKYTEGNVTGDMLGTFINVTSEKDGWIYFECGVEELPNVGVYNGNYRIKTDGSKIEKIDKGDWLLNLADPPAEGANQ